MIAPKHKDLLDAGVHLGHFSRKWHPNMAPFILMERQGIHIIDLNKTLIQLQEAVNSLQAIARAGKKILLVATKKQAQKLVEQEAKRLGMPYMTERWLGGTLTNFITTRRLVKKMTSVERMMKSTVYKNMAKKEQLMIARDRAKLERVLKGIADLTRLPGAIFVVDINREHIAVREANKLGIPVFALTDTNSDPALVNYPIPSNDDATRSIALLVKAISSAIETGLTMRNQDKALEAAEKEAKANRIRKAEKIASTEDQPRNQVLAQKQANVLKSVKSASTEKPIAQETQILGQAITHQAKDIMPTKMIDQTPKAIDKAKTQENTISQAKVSFQASKDKESEINTKEKASTSEVDSPKE